MEVLHVIRKWARRNLHRIKLTFRLRAACTKSEFLLPCKTLAHKRRMKYYLTLHAPCKKAGERYKDQVSMMESTTTTLKVQPSTASKYSSVFSAASSRRWPGQKLATRPSTQSLTNKHVYYKGPKFARRRAQKQFPTNFSPMRLRAAFWWLIAVNVSLFSAAEQTRSCWIGPRQRSWGPRQICIMHSGAKMLYCFHDLISPGVLGALRVYYRLHCVGLAGDKFLNMKKRRAPFL